MNLQAATISNGEWIIRLLRSSEIEAQREMAWILARVVSPVDILHSNSMQMGYVGHGARQQDLNRDTVCRELLDCSVMFVQPHSLEKIEFDEQKFALATAHNTEAIMNIIRRTLRLLDLYTQLRS